MILKRLIDDGVCFALVCGNEYVINTPIVCGLDWFVITTENHFSDRYRKRGFKKTGNKKYTIELTLTKSEAKELESLKHLFVHIESIKEGRIYELKGNSFKEHYERYCEQMELEKKKVA